MAGPTATGKTALAIRLAKHFSTEIISADSRQCYRELRIGVARPTEAELEQVPHHFIASHSIKEEVTAAGFEQFALKKAAELFTSHDQLIMAGGTGLYIRAFCEGLDAMPVINPAIREKIMAAYEEKGMDWLQEEIRTLDPQFSREGEMKNPQRLMRALEVVQATGRSILDYRKGGKAARDFKIIKIGWTLPKEVLQRNISTRVDQMVQAGLVEEARSLWLYRHLNALQTVGYAELFDHFDGHVSLETAIEKIKIHTRQYAKRQLTWFRKDPAWNWFSPGEEERLLAFLSVQLLHKDP